MAFIDEELLKLGLDVNSPWSVGRSVGTNIAASSLQQEDIINGLDAMLATANAGVSAATPEQVLQSLPQASYSNEGQVRANITYPKEGSTVSADPKAGWEEAAPGVFRQRNAGQPTQYTNVLSGGVPTMATYDPRAHTVTPESRAALTGVPNALGGASNIGGADAITAQMQDIQNTADPAQREAKLLKLQENAAQLNSSLLQQSRLEAEKQVGVPQLQSQLQAMEQKDRSHPAWEKYQSDSMETAAVRRQLDQTMQRAEIVAAQKLKENPTFLAANRTVETFTATERGHIEKAYQAQQKKLDKQEFQQEAAADVLAGVSPEALDNLTTVLPNLKGDNVAIAKFVTGAGKEWKPLLDGTIPKTDYLTAAVSGSKPAKALALVEQMKQTGQPQQKVMQDIQDAERFVNDAQFREGAMKAYGMSTGTPAESASAKSANLLKPKTKDELIADRNKAISNLNIFMTKKTLGSLDKVNSWPLEASPLNDPKAQEIFLKVKASNQNQEVPSLVQFAKAYVNEQGITPEERKARENALVTGYATAAMKIGGGGILHSPIEAGTIAMKQAQLRVALANEAYSTSKALGQTAGQSFSLSNPANPLAMPGILTQQVWNVLKETPDVASGFFSGITGGNQ